MKDSKQRIKEVTDKVCKMLQDKTQRLSQSISLAREMQVTRYVQG